MNIPKQIGAVVTEYLLLTALMHAISVKYQQKRNIRKNRKYQLNRVFCIKTGYDGVSRLSSEKQNFLRRGNNMVEKVMRKSYLTPNQVAELLMVTPTAVRQWAEKGDLNALTTPGGHRRFIPGDVERFARERGLTLNLRNEGILRVLIVDDDEQLVRYLARLLEGFPEQVVTETAENGFVAGLKIREFEPHIVLLDLMMPGLNGFEVCSLLKSGPNTKAIRVIAMTGYPSPENIEKIRDSGAEVCLSKPINEQLLLEHMGLTQQAKI